MVTTTSWHMESMAYMECLELVPENFRTISMRKLLKGALPFTARITERTMLENMCLSSRPPTPVCFFLQRCTRMELHFKLMPRARTQLLLRD